MSLVSCYSGRGAGYRGLGGTTLSGAPCLPWDSDLLPGATHRPAPLHLCRNPDGDKMPWCYTLSNGAISWEYCSVPSCDAAVSCPFS
uniref:Kringle domain-containing protein n=1 Tax=Periophthalmus magnuspinnatus TaxID=409849 RepID=A0A3B4BDH2_9GOBI